MGGAGNELANEAALADPGLSDHGDNATGTGRRSVELRIQPFQIRRASDQPGLGADGRGCVVGARYLQCGRRLDRRSLWTLTQDLLIENLRFRFGLDAELPAQHADAVLILAQRRPSPAGLRVESHERSLHRLLQRIQGQEPERGLNRWLCRPCFPLMHEELCETLDRQFTQALALREQPLFEGWFAQREAAQEIALIERCRSLDRVWRSLDHRRLEGRGVDIDRRRVQRDRGAFLPKRPLGPGQRPSDRKESLSKTCPSRPLTGAAPEQRCELL